MLEGRITFTPVEEAVQGEHGEGGGLELEAGKGTSDRKNPAIYAAPIVQQIADGYLQFRRWAGEVGGEASVVLGDWGRREPWVGGT
jgi:hypothetical protein